MQNCEWNILPYANIDMQLRKRMTFLLEIWLPSEKGVLFREIIIKKFKDPHSSEFSTTINWD